MLSPEEERYGAMRLSQMGIFTREELKALRKKIADTAVAGETDDDRQQRAFQLLIDAMLIRGFACNENVEAAGSREEADRSPAPECHQ